MIGKNVFMDELKAVLAERARKKEEVSLREVFERELRSIKKGECLRYECKEGFATLQETTLLLFIANIKGLKLVTSGNFAYIYKK